MICSASTVPVNLEALMILLRISILINKIKTNFWKEYQGSNRGPTHQIAFQAAQDVSFDNSHTIDYSRMWLLIQKAQNKSQYILN